MQCSSLTHPLTYNNGQTMVNKGIFVLMSHMLYLQVLYKTLPSLTIYYFIVLLITLEQKCNNIPSFRCEKDALCLMRKHHHWYTISVGQYRRNVYKLCSYKSQEWPWPSVHQSQRESPYKKVDNMYSFNFLIKGRKWFHKNKKIAIFQIFVFWHWPRNTWA